LVENNVENTVPFAFLGISNSSEAQHDYASRWVEKRYPSANVPFWKGGLYNHDKIRVGYMSADFGQHPVAYLIAGIFGSLSLMMTLYHRDIRGGEGQVMDLALFEAVFRFLDFDPIQYDQMKITHMRTGNRVAYFAPSSMFKTKDRKYLTLAASTQNVWVRLADAIGRKQLTTDPKFIDNPARVENSVEINGIVGEWIERHTRQEVIEHSANTHVIAADAHVGLQLKRLRVGQVVRLMGSLVDGVRDDGVSIHTSLTRSDSGAGACEVMLVEGVEVL